MLFNSLHFLIFFIVVTVTFFSISHSYRWQVLLAASCYFYMAFVPVYLLILGFTIVIDYYAGIFIEGASGKKRKWFLSASIIANVGVLVIFKYYNFINGNFTLLLNGAGYQNPIPALAILLPIGLSFHTFQAMSYTIEVYRGHQKAERHFGIYSLYVMFYPQLVAGPIERPQNLVHQFYEKHEFDYYRITSGLKLMAWGLFKKVVIADRLATVVDKIYSAPHEYTGLTFVLATVFFSFQIFCDFSGYSDMAIGAARVMGFKLMKNFDKPYHSKSVHEFWGRWHISLSSWFRDYLYISLGGNRVSVPRWYINLFIVFLVSGLWHGANWTFIIWGGLHGFYLVFTLITKNTRDKLARMSGLVKVPVLNSLLSIITTYTFVCIAWVFFRANTVADAIYIISKGITGSIEQIQELANHHSVMLKLDFPPYQLAVGFAAIILMETVHLMQGRFSLGNWLQGRPVWMRWSLYYGVMTVILYFGVYENRQFIYFQF